MVSVTSTSLLGARRKVMGGNYAVSSYTCNRSGDEIISGPEVITEDLPLFKKSKVKG